MSWKVLIWEKEKTHLGELMHAKTENIRPEYISCFIKPIPTWYERFPTHLTAGDFWKHCGKRVIAQYEQFLHLPQSFQLYLMIKPLIYGDFSRFCQRVFKSSAADLLYVGKD